jgi:uncharacterized protein YdeI (YjbR/CyaY-like superfamily)
MITVIDDYFSDGCGRCERFATPDCSARRWSFGLAQLRRICLAAGLTETVKWGHPCYMHRDRNVAIFGAFRDDFRLSFFDAALLRDPRGILEKAGPNSPDRDMLRFTEQDQPLTWEPVILAYLQELMGYVEAGLKPPKRETTLELPLELAEALDCDPALAAAFHALTPGRQRGYVIHLNSAKLATTRRARIEKFRPKILAGQGPTD